MTVCKQIFRWGMVNIHGPWILASVGALKEKKATSYFSIKDDIVHAGAEYLDQPVVRDGNLITSRIPGDLSQFCQEIIKSLRGGQA